MIQRADDSMHCRDGDQLALYSEGQVLYACVSQNLQIRADHTKDERAQRSAVKSQFQRKSIEGDGDSLSPKP